MSENVVAGAATYQPVTYQSAERVLALLSSFDDGRTELGVTEIAGLLGVHKSTASRLATALERAGFLTRRGKRYRLGVEVIRLGTLALQSFDIVQAMRPAMEKLSRQTGETVNLAVPDGADVLNVAEVPSTYILSTSGGWVGRRTRPHAVANGKVLLAYGAVPLAASLERYTEHTVTSLDALTEELEAVRHHGYAKAVAEFEEGLTAVAAPVFDHAGQCVAALSVSGPAYRMPTGMLDELGRLSTAAASGTPGPSAGAGAAHGAGPPDRPGTSGAIPRAAEPATAANRVGGRYGMAASRDAKHSDISRAGIRQDGEAAKQ